MSQVDRVARLNTLDEAVLEDLVTFTAEKNPESVVLCQRIEEDYMSLVKSHRSLYGFDRRSDTALASLLTRVVDSIPQLKETIMKNHLRRAETSDDALNNNTRDIIVLDELDDNGLSQDIGPASHTESHYYVVRDTHYVFDTNQQSRSKVSRLRTFLFYHLIALMEIINSRLNCSHAVLVEARKPLKTLAMHRPKRVRRKTLSVRQQSLT